MLVWKLKFRHPFFFLMLGGWSLAIVILLSPLCYPWIGSEASWGLTQNCLLLASKKRGFLFSNKQGKWKKIFFFCFLTWSEHLGLLQAPPSTFVPAVALFQRRMYQGWFCPCCWCHLPPLHKNTSLQVQGTENLECPLHLTEMNIHPFWDHPKLQAEGALPLLLKQHKYAERNL